MKGWLALGFHVRGGQQWWLQWNIKVHDEKPKKKTKPRRRCITSASFEEAYLMAATRLSLSHWKLMLWLQSLFPQVTHVNSIGTSSFAMIPMLNHLEDRCHWDHSVSKTSAHPHIPEASV